MVKTKRKISKKVIDLSAIKIVVGSGVPTSSASVSSTSMKEVGKDLRSASKSRLFDKTPTHCYSCGN